MTSVPPPASSFVSQSSVSWTFAGLFATIPGLDPRNQARAASYIQAFFADIDSGKIFKTCIN